MVDIFDKKLWVKLSLAMSSSRDTMAMVEVQHLCGANARLVKLESLVPTLTNVMDAQGCMPQAECVTEIGGQSWLWVLGAYEVIRRAKTRLQGDAEFKAISDDISEIRIVLAKQEARSNPDLWQRPQHFYTSENCHFGWQYWNRRAEECRFVRAEFAMRWLEYGSKFVPPS